MFFIILVGLLLRLTFIVKAEGLWNDEYVSWYVASAPLFKEFLGEVLKQCHMPLYYIYLKPFVHFSDTILRLTSVLPGVLAIPVMYLVGREYSKKAGYYASIITSILSFLVYYSQEVRFYSLLFLFSSITLLYTIRYLKNPDKINLIGYIGSNLLILSTHIIGIICVFFSALYVVFKKKNLVKFIFGILFLCAILSPFILNVLKMLPASQWWAHFSYTNILFLFSDYFSPILTNNVTAPPVFFYEKSLSVWLVVPTLIAVAGMVAGARKGLGLIALGTVVTLSLLAMSGNLVFITKYSIEILPILILFMALGFERLKKIGVVLLTIFVLFHFSALFTPNYVTKLKRDEGHKIVGDILNFRNPKNVVFTYYEPERFYRYAELDNKNLLYISKSNRHLYQDNPARILSEIPIGETVSVVFLDSVSFLSESIPDGAVIPEMFVTFSKIKHSLIRELDNNYNDYKLDRKGCWTVITAIKLR